MVYPGSSWFFTNDPRRPSFFEWGKHPAGRLKQIETTSNQTVIYMDSIKINQVLVYNPNNSEYSHF